MTIESFKTALAALDEGSFARAAIELNRTEGAVSKQIKQLENQLDLPLFDRRNKPPLASAQALDLLPAMREAVAAYARVFDQARALAGRFEGEIRLGVIPTVAEWTLAPALSRLNRTHPNLRLRIESGLSGHLLEKLGHSRLDAAIITMPEQLPVSVMADLLVAEPIVLIAPAAMQPHDPGALLREQPIIRFNRAAGVGRQIDILLADLAPGRTALIELDSIQAIVDMVSHGLGVALIPNPAGGPIDGHAHGRARLAIHHLPDQRAQREVALARSAKRRNDPLIDAVLQAFQVSLSAV